MWKLWLLRPLKLICTGCSRIHALTLWISLQGCWNENFIREILIALIGHYVCASVQNEVSKWIPGDNGIETRGCDISLCGWCRQGGERECFEPRLGGIFLMTKTNRQPKMQKKPYRQTKHRKVRKWKCHYSSLATIIYECHNCSILPDSSLIFDQRQVKLNC